MGGDALDVDELVELVVLPEGAGEGGGADQEAAVEAEPAGDVEQVAFDPLAGAAAFMQGDPELHDEAGLAAVVVGEGSMRVEGGLSREGREDASPG